MKIYEAEKKLNIDGMIAQANLVEVPFFSNKQMAQADTIFDADVLPIIKKSLSPDLMLVNGILVTTNWNNNDDIFTKSEVWPARYSPIYKPVNVGHKGKERDKENKILGVITSSVPVDELYQEIKEENLPEAINKFHLFVSMYLWEAYFPETSAEIRNSIDSGEMFISMECIFDDFGYGLKNKDGKISLLPRNEKTAWLSGHLRAYGGKGVIKINNTTYRIGRHLRGLNFSGVGFVKKPGNPESIVFEDYVSHASLNIDEGSEEEILRNFDILVNKSVLVDNKGTISLW